MSKDWLPGLMKEWALWWESENAYSDSTTIWRAIMAPTQSGFGPALPKGVEPPPDLRKLVLAMGDLLTDGSCGEDVAYTRAFYVLGIKNVMAHDETKISTASVYQRVERGQSAIRGYMRAL